MMVRVLVQRRCVASATVKDEGDHDLPRNYGHGGEQDDHDDLRFHDYNDDYEGSVGQNLRYTRLPQTQLRLSVFKLDGSFFDVHVARNVTVAKLKEAVEEVFASSTSDSEGKISWMHVWGHFCLSYEGQKLVNDKVRIRDLQIKDGDQLQFVRHMSINYLHSKKLSRTQSVASTQRSMSSSRSGAQKETRQTHLADKDNLENQEDSNYYNYEHMEEIPAPEFKLAHFLRGLLSHTRFWGVSRRTSGGKSRPSRFTQHCLGCVAPQDGTALTLIRHGYRM